MENGMKKILYLECYAGISGDMTVAALLDLGVDRNLIDRAVESIRPLVSGFDVVIKRVQKAGIDACDFDVVLDSAHENHDHDMAYLHGHDHGNTDGGAHDHGHVHAEHSHVHGDGHHDHGQEAHHHHVHRGMAEITEILKNAKLTDSARELALRIFEILAAAEAKAHNKPVSEVHFHEVGAVDSIVDIMSAAVCMDAIKEKYRITDVVISELYEGHGSVRCQHGILPVPVPATAKIMETYGLPVHFMEQQGEFVTPTGAAIAAAVRTRDKLPQKFKVAALGIGAGKRNYEKASLLRAMILEELSEKKDVIYKLESNIDDCSGEAFGYLTQRLFDAGARDVFYTPVYMKKNRPAYQLNVICDRENISILEQIIFDETTTIGVRRVEMERTVLSREKRAADTSLGKLAVKACGGRIYPEYESLAAVCREKGIPYLDTYNRVYAELNQERQRNRKISTVVFDLDGTLLDTLEDLKNAVNYALDFCAMPKRTLDEVRRFVGNGVKKLMIRAVPDGEDNPDFEKAFDAFKQYYGEHCNDTTRAYDGIPELLETLKNSGYTLAIVSNKIDSAVQDLNNRYFPQVDVAIGDREHLQRKPHPDSVNLALKELGKIREEAVYIGDSDVDLATARNAGLPCISVLWGFRDREFLVEQGAETFVEQPMEIVDVLKQMNL